MTEFSTRCLSLWENDNTLIDALEVAKDIIVPLDVLNTLWPCPSEYMLLEGRSRDED